MHYFTRSIKLATNSSMTIQLSSPIDEEESNTMTRSMNALGGQVLVAINKINLLTSS